VIYIISGDEPVLISQNLKSIIEKHKDFNIVRFDGNDKEFSLEDVFNTWTNVDIFGNSSLIIVNDPPFLIKKEEGKLIDSFLDYSKHQDNENVLILYTLTQSFKGTLKTYKTISGNAKVIKYDKLKRNDFFNSAITMLKDNDLVLDKQCTNALINASNGSLSDLKLNIDVLKLYPGKIDINVINNLLSVPVNYDNFDLINAICSKNLSKSEKLINSMIEEKENIIGMISLIAGQLRFLYLIASYLEQGETASSIAKNYGYNEYRVTKAIESLSRLKKKEILRLLNYLADLDLKAKSQSHLSQKSLLQLFVLELINES